MDTEFRTENIPVQLADGSIIKIEVAQTGREDVAFGVKSFASIEKAIERIIQAVSTPIQNAQPDKASVKFGLEIGIDQGSLVAVIVRGTSKASLEITLAWEK
jgi:Trypsin-co-occurring domain 1